MLAVIGLTGDNGKESLGIFHGKTEVSINHLICSNFLTFHILFKHQQRADHSLVLFVCLFVVVVCLFFEI